jgi:DNA-binding protein H-NS
MPTLEQIKEKMKKLQEQADQLIAKRAQSVLTDIRKLMEEHGLTSADIDAHSTGKKNRGRPAGSTPTAATRKAASTTVVKAATPAKYRHPKTGATWTGHGRAPAWIADAKDRRKFLIDGTDALAADVSAAGKPKAATKKTSVATGTGARKGQRKGPQPVKYLDPNTGATWSGRGPAPAWLAAAKDRTKFLADGAGATTAASKAKTPTGNGTAGKQAVTRKASATKKAPVKKTATASNEVSSAPIAA